MSRPTLKGTGRIIAEYVETWDGGHGYPGFCVCRVIEEDGKPIRVERGKPMYLRDMPDMRDWWEVFQRSSANLRGRAWFEEHGKKRRKAA